MVLLHCIWATCVRPNLFANNLELRFILEPALCASPYIVGPCIPGALDPSKHAHRPVVLRGLSTELAGALKEVVYGAALLAVCCILAQTPET